MFLKNNLKEQIQKSSNLQCKLLRKFFEQVTGDNKMAKPTFAAIF